MLFARMNKEYVNEDELAKKIAFERTISFVNKLYPKENPEVALKPGQLTSQLQYGFDPSFGLGIVNAPGSGAIDVGSGFPHFS